VKPVRSEIIGLIIDPSPGDLQRTTSKTRVG
jgi:hypothetical protein